MPTIENLDGVRIVIHNGDHRPPHIHALYNEYEVLIGIKTGKVYAGYLPAKQLIKALDWLETNSDLALSVFKELNPQIS